MTNLLLDLIGKVGKRKLYWEFMKFIASNSPWRSKNISLYASREFYKAYADCSSSVLAVS